MTASDPTAHRLRVPAEVERLAEVRAFVREAVAAFGGSTRAAEDLVQAVDEATCNVMLHGYDGHPGEIELDAALREGTIEIRILDRAPVFDPTALPDPVTAAPARRRPGTAGVGLQLARTMTDALRHHVRPGGGNELTLVRSIDERPHTKRAAEEA
jgi:serine/threonine-protein kinase RsbW